MSDNLFLSLDPSACLHFFQIEVQTAKNKGNAGNMMSKAEAFNVEQASQIIARHAALEGAMVGIGAALIAAAMLAEKLPSALTAIGWGLLAGGLFASLLRDRRSGLVALIVSAALIASINPPAALAAIIFGGALLIVLRFSGAFGAVMLIGLAAWWSAGSPTFESARALVCVDRLKWLALCANHPDAKLLADAERLLDVGVPALLVVLIVLSTNWSRLARNWWHRRKS